MKKSSILLAALLAAVCASSVSAATFTDFDNYKSFEEGENPVFLLDASLGDYFAGEWNGGDYTADEITMNLAEGKGFNGTKALEVASSGTENVGIYLFANDTNGIGTDYSGSNYLRVWADFSAVDFRKANFGVTNSSYTLFSTDEVDGAWDCYFYYSPDGTNWSKMMHGGDGCFGTAQSSPMLGLKGWFAFPTSDFAVRENVNWDGLDDKAPCDVSDINGIYLFWDYDSSAYVNTAFYLDNMEFVADYKKFDYELPAIDASDIILPPTIEEKVSANITEATEGLTDQTVGYLFDFSRKTDYVFNGSTATVVWNYTVPLNAYGYTMSTATNAADNAGSNPTAWTVYGSNDGANWTVLDAVTGDTTLTAENAATFSFDIDTPAEYTWFKLEITANGGAATTALSHFDISCDGYFVMNKEQYVVGEDIIVTMVGTGEWDWCGFYPNDGTEPGTNGSSLCYFYVYESKGAPYTWVSGKNLPAGEYRAQYLLNDGYEYIQTTYFTIVEGELPVEEEVVVEEPVVEEVVETPAAEETVVEETASEETVEEVVEEVVVETPAATAPQTFDAGIIAVIASAITAAAAVIIRKRR